MLEFLKTPSFSKLISSYSAKDAMIISLKLGLIDGKCFSNSAISEFLGIEKEEIIDITKNVLLVYKERINQIMDSAIKIIAEEDTFDAINKTFQL